MLNAFVIKLEISCRYKKTVFFNREQQKYLLTVQ